jgi:outer membrane protein
MMEVARTYLAAVLADETLRVLQQEHTAVETALADVQERFRQGDVPATDTHEAAAREKSLQAQILAARTDDDVRHQALADMIGIEPAAQVLFAPSSKTEQLIQPGVDSLTQVLAQATEGNPELKARHGAVELAREQVRRYRATADTSVDLVARVGRDAISGSGDFGGAANSASSALIGVQVSIPVFTGGYHSAQHDEARHLLDQAVAEETRARQQVALQTRSAWMTIRVGRERIEALVQALKANQDRYDTTRLGHDVGDRSTLDLLNARSDAARAELDLLQARADLIVQRLQLLALTGHLDDTQLHDVSGVLTQSLTPSADPGMPVAMTSR